MNQSTEYILVPIYNIVHRNKLNYYSSNQSWIKRKHHPFHAEQLQYDHIFTDEQRRRGAVLLHIALCFYTFFALAILCEDYFCASLEKLCLKMKIPGDIAGATFMAAGSSMPTLFICIISLFLGESAIGLGTIIGSTLFNILFITAATALLATKVLHLHRWPLLRDSFAYSLHLIVLLIIIADSKVHWYEGILILLLYGVYILTLIYDVELHSLCKRILKDFLSADEDENECMVKGTKSAVTQTDDVSRSQDDGHSESTDESIDVLAGEREISRERNLEAVNQIIDREEKKHWNIFSRGGKETVFSDNKSRTKLDRNTPENSREDIDVEDSDYKTCGESNPFSLPTGWLRRLFWAFLLPIRLLYFATMPDVRKERWQNWYPATFLISITWMAIISYILVWAVAIIGETLRFPEALMGLFLLAAGSSVPDAIASVVVARRGDGDMAIASCVGSNIFDIVCLAIPWIVATSIIHPNSVVLIEGEHMIFTSLTLFGSIVACVFTIHINKWRLTKRTGVTFIVVYVIFMIICGTIELLPLHGNMTSSSIDSNSSDQSSEYTGFNTTSSQKRLPLNSASARHRIIYDTRNSTKYFKIT